MIENVHWSTYKITVTRVRF